MGSVTDMAAYVARGVGKVAETAEEAVTNMFIGRSPMIPLRVLVTGKNQDVRDDAWMNYAARLRRHGDDASADTIIDKLQDIWAEESPPVELELVGLPARGYVEGEYVAPAEPEPTTVEDEELFMALVDQLNLLTRERVLHKWSVKPNPKFEGDWCWTIVAFRGSGTQLTRLLTTKQVSQAIDDFLIDRRKEHP